MTKQYSRTRNQNRLSANPTLQEHQTNIKELAQAKIIEELSQTLVIAQMLQTSHVCKTELLAVSISSRIRSKSVIIHQVDCNINLLSL